jgi:hypothetical protein
MSRSLLIYGPLVITAAVIAFVIIVRLRGKTIPPQYVSVVLALAWALCAAAVVLDVRLVVTGAPASRLFLPIALAFLLAQITLSRIIKSSRTKGVMSFATLGIALVLLGYSFVTMHH